MSGTVGTPERNTKGKFRSYFMTWNNYPENWKSLIIDSCDKYVAQEEIGDNGNRHIQGYLSFKNPRSFDSVRKMFEGAHLEPPKSHVAAINYCKKLNSRNGEQINNIDKHIDDPLEGKELYDWQKNILKIIDTKPDNRTIHWIYDEEGNKGKTTFCKHLVLSMQKKILVMSGKANDIKYGVSCFLKKNELLVAIFHFVRTQENYISYEAIESIKDGMFYNSKYECEMVVFNSPHVFVFSNFEPNYDKLSKDRWNIIVI